MPIFAYQSLNSNSSTDHGISASNSQRFTRNTHNHQASDDTPWLLNMPTASSVDPHIPIHGPAQLIRQAPNGFMAKGAHDNASFLHMIEDKARQSHQHIIRAMGQSCDLLVYGELNANHSDWSSLMNNAGALVTATSTGKACNSFSVHASNSTLHTPLGSGMGWIAVKSGNVNAVFVHVPNSIAKSESDATQFYSHINNYLIQQGHGPIDLVMGDTNQSSGSFTPRVLSSATHCTFIDAQGDGDITPFDSYQRSFGGTNSTGTKKYDVAIYNSETVTVSKISYLSQSTPIVSPQGNLAAAVTDHMGLVVNIAK